MPEGIEPIYKTIFIIDDDIEDQEIFLEAVRDVDSRINCSASTNGEEALEQLAKDDQLPDIIFLDLNMPKLNGKQILAGIKAIPRVNKIPVVMYSTSFAPRDLEEMQRVGAAHHLLKPSRFEDLCEALRQILTKSWN